MIDLTTLMILATMTGTPISEQPRYPDTTYRQVQPVCEVGPQGRAMAARVGEVLIEALKSDDSEVLILAKRVSRALLPDGCL
jgi:hypothetical protein